MRYMRCPKCNKKVKMHPKKGKEAECELKLYLFHTCKGHKPKTISGGGANGTGKRR